MSQLATGCFPSSLLCRILPDRYSSCSSAFDDAVRCLQKLSRTRLRNHGSWCEVLPPVLFYFPRDGFCDNSVRVCLVVHIGERGLGCDEIHVRVPGTQIVKFSL